MHGRTHKFKPSWFLCPQYGGTRTVREGYTFDVAHQIGEGTYGQVFVGNCKKDKVKVTCLPWTNHAVPLCPRTCMACVLLSCCDQDAWCVSRCVSCQRSFLELCESRSDFNACPSLAFPLLLQRTLGRARYNCKTRGGSRVQGQTLCNQQGVSAYLENALSSFSLA